MAKLSDLFGRKGGEAESDKLAGGPATATAVTTIQH